MNQQLNVHYYDCEPQQVMLVLSLNLHVPVISETLGFCYVLTLPKTVLNNKCLSGMYSSGT